MCEIGDSKERIEMCLNCTRDTCNNCYENKDERLGIVRSRKNGKINMKEFMKFYSRGYSDYRVAAELKVSVGGVNSFRTRHGLPANGKGGRNGANG